MKWEKSTPEARLFLPREEEADGMKKIIKNGKLVINGVEIGNVAELEFPRQKRNTSFFQPTSPRGEDFAKIFKAGAGKKP